jgi:hypothetical protein
MLLAVYESGIFDGNMHEVFPGKGAGPLVRTGHLKFQQLPRLLGRGAHDCTPPHDRRIVFARWTDDGREGESGAALPGARLVGPAGGAG